MADAIWQAFTETGNPLCYLLYKSVNGALEESSAAGNNKEKTESKGRQPRAED